MPLPRNSLLADSNSMTSVLANLLSNLWWVPETTKLHVNDRRCINKKCWSITINNCDYKSTKHSRPLHQIWKIKNRKHRLLKPHRFLSIIGGTKLFKRKIFSSINNTGINGKTLQCNVASVPALVEEQRTKAWPRPKRQQHQTHYKGAPGTCKDAKESLEGQKWYILTIKALRWLQCCSFRNVAQPAQWSTLWRHQLQHFFLFHSEAIQTRNSQKPSRCYVLSFRLILPHTCLLNYNRN